MGNARKMKANRSQRVRETEGCRGSALMLWHRFAFLRIGLQNGRIGWDGWVDRAEQRFPLTRAFHWACVRAFTQYVRTGTRLSRCRWEVENNFYISLPRHMHPTPCVCWLSIWKSGVEHCGKVYPTPLFLLKRDNGGVDEKSRPNTTGMVATPAQSGFPCARGFAFETPSGNQTDKCPQLLCQIICFDSETLSLPKRDEASSMTTTTTTTTTRLGPFAGR